MIVTITLVLVTLALAWATRSIGRASFQEVRAQTRPMVLPALDAEARFTTTQQRQTQGGFLTYAHLPLRNAGSGPALNVGLAMASPYQESVLMSQFLPAIAAGDSMDVHLPVFDSGEKTVTCYVEYTDLAGARYSTTIDLNLTPDPSETSVAAVSLQEGKSFSRPAFPSLKPLATRYRRPPLRPRLRKALDELFLAPGELITPLRPRMKAAWRAIRPERRQTVTQRLRWALAADRSNRRADGSYVIPPAPDPVSIGSWMWTTPGIRRRLYVARVRFQRMRWAYHEFR